MTTYDWIVIGAGITGASLAYELSQQNFKVLLLEKDPQPDNATVYSYGGLAYWSGTDELTRTLAQSGIELHRHLSAELDADTEFRELDLVLTIDRQDDPQAVALNYDRFAVTPELLNVQDACTLEPLLNPNAISGVLKLPHGHIQAQKTTNAYIQAMLRNGGKIIYEQVVNLVRQGDKITGVTTTTNNYYGNNTVVCGGGLSRSLLQQAGVKVNNYFTHAQLIMTPPMDLELATIVMPAVQQRFRLEAQPAAIDPGDRVDRVILDPGAVQFIDGSLCIGQISAIAEHPQAKFDLAIAEAQIREQVGYILPLLEDIPGTCHSCLVAFNNQGIALVGNLANITGLYLFSGFTSTLVYAPVLARRFAQSQTGTADKIIEQLQLTLTKSI
ncbi:MAG: FAD-binding oxidoreductase [Pleurocapsa minor HA4230-MV1]|jgi:glycine/D-amino acid oxidase-like deaminating enzyme|nr:FAD-binding oxidoreductase [Pleurocapsa minor HA4230-MV1]